MFGYAWVYCRTSLFTAVRAGPERSLASIGRLLIGGGPNRERRTTMDEVLVNYLRLVLIEIGREDLAAELGELWGDGIKLSSDAQWQERISSRRQRPSYRLGCRYRGGSARR